MPTSVPPERIAPGAFPSPRCANPAAPADTEATAEPLIFLARRPN